MDYKLNELANGNIVGVKRRKHGKSNEFEYWSGTEWVDEFLWELSMDVPYVKETCQGCDDPFCECGGKTINSPFDDEENEHNEYAEIIKLLELSDNINLEIRKRLAKLGGDN